jgi:hypothetical protein
MNYPKDFIFWLFDPKCPFTVSYNGIQKDHDKIRFEKLSVIYLIEEVFEIWKEKVKP